MTPPLGSGDTRTQYQFHSPAREVTVKNTLQLATHHMQQIPLELVLYAKEGSCMPEQSAS